VCTGSAYSPGTGKLLPTPNRGCSCVAQAGAGGARKGKPIVPSKQRPTSRSLGRLRLSAGRERSTNGAETSPTQDRDSRSVPEACVAYPRSRGRPGEADSPPSSPQEGRGEEPDPGQATGQETCRQAAGRTARTGAGGVSCRPGAPRGLHPPTDASARADAARPLGPTGGTSSRGCGNGGRGRRGAVIAPRVRRCNASRRTGPAFRVAGPDTCRARGYAGAPIAKSGSPGFVAGVVTVNITTPLAGARTAPRVRPK
jgi:hypothetical protein